MSEVERETSLAERERKDKERADENLTRRVRLGELAETVTPEPDAAPAPKARAKRKASTSKTTNKRKAPAKKSTK